MAMLKETEKTMTRAICGVKLIEKRSDKELMDLRETLDGLATASRRR